MPVDTDLQVAKINRSSAIGVAVVTALAGAGAGLFANLPWRSAPACVSAGDFDKLNASAGQLDAAWKLYLDTAKICVGDHPLPGCEQKATDSQNNLQAAQQQIRNEITAMKTKCAS